MASDILPAWLHRLGTYQLVCASLAALTQLAFVALYGARVQLWLAITALAVTGVGIHGGELLRRGDRRGLLPTLVTQALQVVSVGSAWSFVYLAGPKLALVVADAGVGLAVGAGGSFHVGPRTGMDLLSAQGIFLEVGAGYWPTPFADATWAASLNVVPLYAFVRLLEFMWSERKRAREQATAAPIMSSSPTDVS